MSGARPKPDSYTPYAAARRPGGPPDYAPTYRVLVHKKLLDRWEGLEGRVGLENAQQFWDHVAQDPGHKPSVGSSCILRGKAGRPMADGFSRTVHYEISGAGRIDYQFHDGYVAKQGDPHKVVFIVGIDLGSH